MTKKIKKIETKPLMFPDPNIVINALIEGDGYVSQVAQILGCNASTVYNYRDRFPEVAEAWKNIREQRHDYVENALHKRINEGDTTAIIFYLKTQGKQRGYTERFEHDVVIQPIQRIVENRD